MGYNLTSMVRFAAVAPAAIPQRKEVIQMSKVRIPYIDYTSEKSTASFYVDSAIGDAAITAIVTAVDGVTVGGRQDAVLVVESTKDAGTAGPAASPLAQRENKWLVRGVDSVNGRNVQIEIPCADLTLLTGGQDFLDLGGTEAAALVAALEANVESQDGNAITVSTIQFVGRNL